MSTETPPRSVARPASGGNQTIGAVLLAVAGFGILLIYLRSPGGEWLRVKLGLQQAPSPVMAAPPTPAPSASSGGAGGSTPR